MGSSAYVDGATSSNAARKGSLREITSAFARGRNAEAIGHVHELRQRFRPHLAHHPSAMRFHGDLADAELAAHLLVQLATNDERHHFLFARTESAVPVAQSLQIQ